MLGLVTKKKKRTQKIRTEQHSERDRMAWHKGKHPKTDRKYNENGIDLTDGSMAHDFVDIVYVTN